jgi:endonuclease YncB( thermonuclease family)
MRRCLTNDISYHRRVAQCHITVTSEDIAAAMVESGYAVDWTYYSCGHYKPLMISAAARKSGLWHRKPGLMHRLSRDRSS